jgi:hypothetical protein
VLFLFLFGRGGVQRKERRLRLRKKQGQGVVSSSPSAFWPFRFVLDASSENAAALGFLAASKRKKARTTGRASGESVGREKESRKLNRASAAELLFCFSPGEERAQGRFPFRISPLGRAEDVECFTPTGNNERALEA